MIFDKRSRRMRNRISALEESVRSAKLENSALDKENRALRRENDALREAIDQINVDHNSALEELKSAIDELTEAKKKYTDMCNQVKLIKKSYQNEFEKLINRLRKQA